MAKKTGREKPLKQYECGAFRFSGKANLGYYERHLVFDHAVSVDGAGQRERFEAAARALRDVLTQRWLLTRRPLVAAQTE